MPVRSFTLATVTRWSGTRAILDDRDGRRRVEPVLDQRARIVREPRRAHVERDRLPILASAAQSRVSTESPQCAVTSRTDCAWLRCVSDTGIRTAGDRGRDAGTTV
jgi:hypothetical protein